MEFGYFPGCSLTGTGKEFDMSLKEVLKVLEVNLNEIKDWSCCGASSAHVTSHLLSVALPARNLLLAKDLGMDNIVAPCAACYNRLLSAQTEIKNNEKIRSKVEEILDHKVTNNLEILNIVQLFNSIGIEKLKEKKQIDFKDLKAACYYGCLLVRPNSLTKFDDEEQPKRMEEILDAVGVKTVDWNFKTECCGAAHSIAHQEIVERLSKNIIDDAINKKADFIVVACPMCHSNLDMRQRNIQKNFKEHKTIPILYLSEIIGLALGIEPEKLGLKLHFIEALSLFRQNKVMEAAV